MKMKKLLRSGLAVLCIVSMMLGYFGGLSPESKVEAAETVETLPTDFTEVTPREFGIADFSENTAQTLYTNSMDPITSVDKVMFSSKVIFGAKNAQISYCEPFSTGYSGGINIWVQSNTELRIQNAAGGYGLYIGGEFVKEGETSTYQGGTHVNDGRVYTFTPCFLTGTQTLATEEVLFTLTTEVVDFDLDGAIDDLKIGLWFDGVLQDNAYIYIKDCTVVSKPFLSMKVMSSSSPEITQPEQPEPEKPEEPGQEEPEPTIEFKEVTPREFGIADFSENTAQTLYTNSMDPITSVDKVMFSSKVIFGAKNAQISYCEPMSNGYSGGINIWVQSNTELRIQNAAGGYGLYVGGEFVKDGETVVYQGGTYVDNRIHTFVPCFLTGTQTLATEEVLFTLTTEVVDFDLDGAIDDLKIGLWFDGVLQDNAYIYIKDCTVVSKPFLSMKVMSSSSPFVSVKSQWDDYKTVTPAAFGIEDFSGNTEQNKKTYSTKPFASFDNVVFRTKLTFGANNSAIYYGEPGGKSTNAGAIGLWARGGTTLRFNNDAASWTYIGGTSIQDGVEAASRNYDFTPCFLTGSQTLATTEVEFAITTELVDYNLDGNENDLKVGLWFNGVLQDNTFLYLTNFESADKPYLTMSVQSSMSPQVSPDDLGLASGEYGATDNTIATSAVATSKVMNGTTLETDVLFNGVGASLLYGCGEDTSKAIKLTSTTEGIKLSHTYNDTDEQIALLTKDLVGIDLVNNQFHLKLTTDVVNSDDGSDADDIKLGVQINNKAGGYVISKIAPELTGRIGVKSMGDASVIIGSFASDKIDEVQHCLDDGVYTVENGEEITRLSVNGKVQTDYNITLDSPGTYQIVSTKNRLIYRQEVVLYKLYDLNKSNTVDVKDLVRMLKVANDSTHADTVAELGKVGKLAIAYESADTWSNDIALSVLEFMRRELVGAGTPEKKTAEITSINREQLQQFANEHGAITGDFTFTVDLASESVKRTEQIWILSTNAKYISVNGNYPTIQFKLMNKELTRQLYISQTYKTGDKNVSVERQLRVPETLEDYTVLQVSFVIPDGVALYIDDISDENNNWNEDTKDQFLSEEDDTIYSADDNVKYLAHSGFIGYAPDNTIRGFEMAGKMGFKSLITIPKFTKPTVEDPIGKGVCFHDDFIHDRLVTDEGEKLPVDETIGIEDYTYEELKQFDAGLREGEIYSCDVPTLYEYFTICDQYKMAPVFSLHPDLTVVQWTYVKNLLQEFKDETGYSWIYDHFQIKVGTTQGLQDAFSVFGFDIGYIIIQTPAWTAASKIGVLTDAGILAAAEKKAKEDPDFDMFDKVSVEIFKSDPQLEDEIAYLRDYGFTRISLAPGSGLSGGFSGEEQRYYMDLGVNSFTVDFHGSMGLNW